MFCHLKVNLITRSRRTELVPGSFVFFWSIRRRVYGRVVEQNIVYETVTAVQTGYDARHRAIDAEQRHSGVSRRVDYF